MSQKSRKQFAAIPLGAISDARPTASHWWLLAAIAMHDRLGVNGTGCYASHETLAEEAKVHFTNVSKLASDLVKFGYMSVQPGSRDKRRRVYSLIYKEKSEMDGELTYDSQGNADVTEIVGELTYDSTEIVGDEKCQVAEFAGRTDDNIFRKTESNNFREAGVQQENGVGGNTGAPIPDTVVLKSEILRLESEISLHVGKENYLQFKLKRPEFRKGSAVQRIAALNSLVKSMDAEKYPMNKGKRRKAWHLGWVRRR